MESGQIAVVGNYLPRKCGIATFTTDLCDSLVALRGEDACFTVAIVARRQWAEWRSPDPGLRSAFDS